METKDHYRFGVLAGNNFGRNMTYLQKKALVFGCIEPDMNPLTYIKRKLQTSKAEGA